MTAIPHHLPHVDKHVRLKTDIPALGLCCQEAGSVCSTNEELSIRAGQMETAVDRRRQQIQEDNEQRQLTNERMASDKRLRELADAMPQIVWMTRPDGYHEYFNRRWFDYTGMTAEQSLGDAWTQVVHPDDLQRALDRWNLSLKTGEPYEMEYRFRRASDGSYRWQLGRALPRRDGKGKIVQWYGTCTDIEKQKNGEELNARLASIIASSEDAIISKTLDGIITTWNEGAEKLLGYTAHEAIGRPVTFLIPPDRQREESAILERLGRGERVKQFETVRVAKDGRYVDVSLMVSPIKDAAGKVVGASKIARDITAQNQVRDELQRAKQAAEAANNAKDHFLAVLSHELRTPLTPVLAMVTYMEAKSDLPPELRTEISAIRRNIEMEARLIDDLLDLTRISRGTVDLHFEVVDANASLRAALEVCQGQIESKHIEVTLSLWAKQHHIWADPGRIQQVFLNLVGNAVKFTPEGGRIGLRTASDEQGPWSLEVSDSGIGIKAESLKRIFNAFEQGEKTVTRRFGGVGLGLAIAKSLVDLHRGSLSAASQGKDQGATFTLHLETVPAVPVEWQPSTPHTPAPGRKEKRILLVDDHEDTCRIMARLLRGFGYMVKTAGNVKSALQLVDTEPFDLLISDIGLPDGSGLEIMRQVKARHHMRGIALSGLGMEEDVRSSREAGFEQHLVKPVSFQHLEQAIQRIVA
jgi:PAS domain S-box-containing protein